MDGQEDLGELEGYKITRINENYYIKFEGLEVMSISLDLTEIRNKNNFNNHEITDIILSMIKTHQLLIK